MFLQNDFMKFEFFQIGVFTFDAVEIVELKYENPQFK